MNLTSRQLEVLQLVAAGNSNDEVASNLNIATTTVKAHLRLIYQICNLKNRVEATNFYNNIGVKNV